ncbi:MAG TPA: BlaI/MecI/CopY family transcriptional regulator [Terriglobales bacterium]|nr:BlaI/MecI/CopY family transcriptional regulator [Terriglobales bacterium]
MPPKRSETLTEAELRVMNVLWTRGASTVQQVLEVLPKELDLAYNSVLTTIRVLENKGYVEHTKESRAHIYRPIVAREEARSFEVRHLVNRFFGNSHESLLLNLLEDTNLDPDELNRLRRMLQGEDGQ